MSNYWGRPLRRKNTPRLQLLHFDTHTEHFQIASAARNKFSFQPPPRSSLNLLHCPVLSLFFVLFCFLEMFYSCYSSVYYVHFFSSKSQPSLCSVFSLPVIARKSECMKTEFLSAFPGGNLKLLSRDPQRLPLSTLSVTWTRTQTGQLFIHFRSPKPAKLVHKIIFLFCPLDLSL